MDLDMDDEIGTTVEDDVNKVQSKAFNPSFVHLDYNDVTLQSPNTNQPLPVLSKKRQCNTLVIQSDMTIAHPMMQTRRLNNAILDLNVSGSFTHIAKANRRCTPQDISWCDDALRLISLPNAGGNSIWSEAMSLEVLYRAFDARLEKTEMEIRYFPYGSKITDYSVRISEKCVGVSVTRAMTFGQKYTRSDAERLLKKKLFGVIMSSQNVMREDGWIKQVLHVLTPNQAIADLLEQVFYTFSPELISNTVLLQTVCPNMPWLFTDRKSKYNQIGCI